MDALPASLAVRGQMCRAKKLPGLHEGDFGDCYDDPCEVLGALEDLPAVACHFSSLLRGLRSPVPSPVKPGFESPSPGPLVSGLLILHSIRLFRACAHSGPLSPESTPSLPSGLFGPRASSGFSSGFWAC